MKACKENETSPLLHKERVVISCVSFETVKVVKPIRELRADKAYLLIYIIDAYKDKKNIYTAFRDEVIGQLREDPGLTEEKGDLIVETHTKTFRFDDALGAILSILRKESERGSQVYINVTAGPSEFIAAATLAAMMVPGTKAFGVAVKEYMVDSEERVREVFFEGDRPIGQARDVSEPREIPTFKVDMPPEDLVRGLRVLQAKLNDKQPCSYPYMIRALKENGVWAPDGPSEQVPSLEVNQKKLRPTASPPEKMRYRRHFLDSWERLCWVEKDGERGRVKITKAGKNVLNIFYLD